MLQKRYRTLAERCMQRLRMMEDGADRALLVQMAQTWLRLAKREEQGDAGHQVSDPEGLPAAVHSPEKR
jgi:hypothetical protein